jgi:hypothetical protein
MTVSLETATTAAAIAVVNYAVSTAAVAKLLNHSSLAQQLLTVRTQVCLRSCR